VLRVLDSEWLAAGPENEAFEREFAKYVGTDYAVCVNSGTSANILALAALELPPGSKVLTSGCGFPATLSPILHCGLEPVLVDYDLETLNIHVGQVLARIATSDIKAIILAHSLGSPVELSKIRNACKEKGIFLIEDCCEAVGSMVNGEPVGKHCSLATYSFYPAHQITAGGAGGMIVTNNEDWCRNLKSLRDWGKCWNWDEQLGHKKTSYGSVVDGIPYYQHYIYDTVGYNMKLPDICAAFGRCQIEKLRPIAEDRMANYLYIKTEIDKIGCFEQIKTLENSIISWFGYPLMLRDGYSRDSLGKHLEDAGIRHRPFFAGNITRHRPFRHLKIELPNADRIMRDVLFFGIWQGMGRERLNYIVERIGEWKDSQSVS